MDNYELMENSVQKNIQELTEFCVDNMHVSNYYDLIDLMIELWNIRAKLKKKDNKLFEEIKKEIGELK